MEKNILFIDILCWLVKKYIIKEYWKNLVFTVFFMELTT